MVDRYGDKSISFFNFAMRRLQWRQEVGLISRQIACWSEPATTKLLGVVVMCTPSTNETLYIKVQHQQQQQQVFTNYSPFGGARLITSTPVPHQGGARQRGFTLPAGGRHPDNNSRGEHKRLVPR